MIRVCPLALAVLLTACATPSMNEPSLARRAAEDIDPRVPIPSDVPEGAADARLAATLSTLVDRARAGQAEFDRRAAEASSLAAAAGGEASESWIAAQQALSRLVEQQGVAATVAADIDALASNRLQTLGWMPPADQRAVRLAQEQVGAIAAAQLETIDRLRDQIAS